MVIGNQPVAWKEFCAEYLLKEDQESMDWCTGHCSITEIVLKMVLNNIHSINQLSSSKSSCWLLEMDFMDP